MIRRDLMPTVSATIAAARKTDSIRDWMWANYDVFSQELNRRGRDWEGLAEYAASEGLRNGRGNKPTGRVMQDTWRKVVKEKGGTVRRRRRRLAGKFRQVAGRDS
jgi:hypothetical protein